MRAICIDTAPTGGMWWPLSLLKEGNEYNVVEIKDNGGYVLRETYKQQYEVRQGFRPQRFIPISEIDETELIRENKECFS